MKYTNNGKEIIFPRGKKTPYFLGCALSNLQNGGTVSGRNRSLEATKKKKPKKTKLMI